MENPCATCKPRIAIGHGCGEFHNICVPYQKWSEFNQKVNKEKSMSAEIGDYRTKSVYKTRKRYK